MDNSQYLNENSYQRSKKRLLCLSLITFLAGLFIGSGLIVTGVVLTNNANSADPMVISPTPSSSDSNSSATRPLSEINSDIASAQAQINHLDSEIAQLETEKNQVFIEDFGFSDRYNAIETTIADKNAELRSLYSALSGYQAEFALAEDTTSTNNSNQTNNKVPDAVNQIFGNATGIINSAKYAFFYIIGGFIFGLCSLIALSLLIFAKRREIFAFRTQQILPIAQEGIQQMTPTLSKAAGTMSESITRGIQNGRQSQPDSNINRNPTSSKQKR